RLDLSLALDHRSSEIERSCKVDGAVLDGKDHRLFRRQAERLLVRVEDNVAVGGLRMRPFADVTFGQTGPLRELGAARRTMTMEGIEQSEPKADTNRRHAERAAEVAEHLSHQGVKLIVVEITHSTAPFPSSSQLSLTIPERTRDPFSPPKRNLVEIRLRVCGV